MFANHSSLLWNPNVMEPQVHGLQDTSVRFLDNIQRNGTFSVIPQISDGEITPDTLGVIGQVVQIYDLVHKNY
jgi:NAD(P)H-nitrite reductase large subunit